jgi:hypothetical protein
MNKNLRALLILGLALFIPMAQPARACLGDWECGLAAGASAPADYAAIAGCVGLTPVDPACAPLLAAAALAALAEAHYCAPCE